MRAVVWNRDNEDDYDDLSSMAPSARQPREPLPESPLPRASQWRHAPRPKPVEKRILSAEACIILSLACLALVVIVALDSPSLYRLDYAAACTLLAGISIASGYWAGRFWSEGTTANQEVRWLALDVGVEGSYPVRIRIYQNHAITGIDEGIAYFRNDAIHFHGLRCDFVLGAQDLRFDKHTSHTPHGFIERGFVYPALALRHPELEIDVWFQPYCKLSKHDHRDCNYRFRRDLRMFLHTWRLSHEPSLYPPLEPEPERSRNRSRASTISS
jgi:hypothetical protein